jgi:hypothetical protein
VQPKPRSQHVACLRRLYGLKRYGNSRGLHSKDLRFRPVSTHHVKASFLILVGRIWSRPHTEFLSFVRTPFSTCLLFFGGWQPTLR